MSAPLEPPAPGTLRYLVWLFTIAGGREDVAALLALEAEVLSSASVDLDHDVAHRRLDWWAQEAERAARGTPLHPATRRWLVARRSLGSSALPALVESMRWELAGVAYESRAELERACDVWSRTIFVELAEWAHADPFVALQAGLRIREIELLRGVRGAARAGRIHVPLQELDRVGLDHTALQTEPLAPAVSGLIGERLARLDGELAAMDVGLRGPARVWAHLARHSARCGRRGLPRPETESRLESLGRLFVAWRAVAGTGKVRA